MKCCKFLLIFFMALGAQAAVFTLAPVDQAKVETGDIVHVIVSPQSGTAKIPDFKGKRIGGIFYVLEQDDNKLKALIANPQSLEEAEPSGEHKFILQGFEFKHKKTPDLQDFLVEDVQYDLSGNAGRFIILIFAILLFLSPFIYKKAKQAVQKKAEKKQKKKEVEEFLGFILAAKDREDIEKIFLRRRELEEYFDFEDKAYKNFLKELDQIQYKPEWKTAEEEKIKAALAAFKKELSAKRGI